MSQKCSKSQPIHLDDQEFDQWAHQLHEVDDAQAGVTAVPCQQCRHRFAEAVRIPRQRVRPTCAEVWHQKSLQHQAIRQFTGEVPKQASRAGGGQASDQATRGKRLVNRLWGLWWQATGRASQHAPWSDD